MTHQRRELLSGSAYRLIPQKVKAEQFSLIVIGPLCDTGRDEAEKQTCPRIGRAY